MVIVLMMKYPSAVIPMVPRASQDSLLLITILAGGRIDILQTVQQQGVKQDEACMPRISNTYRTDRIRVMRKSLCSRIHALSIRTFLKGNIKEAGKQEHRHCQGSTFAS